MKAEPQSRLDWDDLRVFLAVARSGQLLAAARQLGVNHATVSRRLQQLESALGQTLVHRRTHGCDLSPAGLELRERAERIEAETVAIEAGGGGERALSGTVRIGAPDGFGLHFIAPRLGGLAERHPGLVLELVPMGRSLSLSQREADLAITVQRPHQQALIARRLVDYELGLYASEDYLRRRGEPADAAALQAHQLVGYVPDLVYSPVLDYSAEFGRQWRSAVAIASAVGQCEAVAAGAGIGILHCYIAATRASLRRVLPALSARRSYWMVRHQSLRHAAAVEAVADFLLSAVTEPGIDWLGQCAGAKRE